MNVYEQELIIHTLNNSLNEVTRTTEEFRQRDHILTFTYLTHSFNRIKVIK